MEILAGIIAENGKDARVAARGDPRGMVRTSPSWPWAQRLSIQGVLAASMGVLPDRAGRGHSAMPSPMTKRYFTGTSYLLNINLKYKIKMVVSMHGLPAPVASGRRGDGCSGGAKRGKSRPVAPEPSGALGARGRRERPRVAPARKQPVAYSIALSWAHCKEKGWPMGTPPLAAATGPWYTAMAALCSRVRPQACTLLG